MCNEKRFVTKELTIDGSSIINMDCPKCGYNQCFVGDTTENEIIEFECGHTFQVIKLVLELHLKEYER